MRGDAFADKWLLVRLRLGRIAVPTVPYSKVGIPNEYCREGLLPPSTDSIIGSCNGKKSCYIGP